MTCPKCSVELTRQGFWVCLRRGHLSEVASKGRGGLFPHWWSNFRMRSRFHLRNTFERRLPTRSCIV
jgi:hypothetical protein